MHGKKKTELNGLKPLLLALMILLALGQSSVVLAQNDLDHDGISDAKEEELANLYAPYLQFKARENFFPVDVNYHLENSVLKLRTGIDVILVDSSPSVATISTYDSEYYFLDNRLGGFSEISADYNQKKNSLGYTVYARVTRESGFLIVQYWFFYAYNDGQLNQHEGDWEMIEVLLDAGENPVSAVYSQHLQEQRALWADVEKVDGTHPKVYVARGSHANYFRSYQGRLGFENDEVGADGVSLAPSEITLVVLGEQGAGNHPSSQNWLDFQGRWGDWAELADVAVGFAGPHGPGHGENSEKWGTPVSWGQSFILVGNMWFTLSWFAANFLLIFLGVTGVLSLFKVWRIVKIRKKKESTLPIMLKTKASVGILLGIAGIILTVAGMFLPWYMIEADIQTTALSTAGKVELLIFDGIRGLQLNLLAGGGLSPAFGLRVPFSILLLTGVILSILDIIGADKGLGNKYIRSGIFFFILVGVLLAFVSQITASLPSLAANLGLSLPPETLEMAEVIAQQPLQGEQTYNIENVGSVYLAWGLGLGVYMFLASAIVKIIGGLIIRKTAEPKAQPEQPNMEQKHIEREAQ